MMEDERCPYCRQHDFSKWTREATVQVPYTRDEYDILLRKCVKCGAGETKVVKTRNF